MHAETGMDGRKGMTKLRGGNSELRTRQNTKHETNILSHSLLQDRQCAYIVLRLGVYRHISNESPSTKFHENPSRKRRYIRTDGYDKANGRPSRVRLPTWTSAQASTLGQCHSRFLPSSHFLCVSFHKVSWPWNPGLNPGTFRVQNFWRPKLHYVFRESPMPHVHSSITGLKTERGRGSKQTQPRSNSWIKQSTREKFWYRRRWISMSSETLRHVC
jgi:hypothetical protein